MYNYLRNLEVDKILDENYISKFINFFVLLKEYNSKFNLTGLKDDRELIVNLFVDSLIILKTNIVSQCETILDIGTGAGFPGIPNAIYLTNKSFVLIDSSKKKCSFLENIKNI
jgi:16S rRNA (guanine527-N7)-methyltransferase